MKSFAIVLICYNRIEGLKRLVKSLEKVDYNMRNDIDLIFSIDKSGNMEVQNFAENYEWPYGEKKIRTFKERQGLKKHILQCGDFTNDYDIVSLFEDDLYVSDSFYNYAYQAANYYWNDERIAGISLYNFQKNWLQWLLRFEPQKSKHDVYFLKIAQSWGQVWTHNKWSKFKEWYSLNQTFEVSEHIPNALNNWPETSWLKYHDRYCIETNKYFVYPYVSLSTNFSDAGQHSQRTVTDHQVELQYGKSSFSFCELDSNAVVYDEYMNREGLEKYLGIDEGSLCVDLWGTKNETHYKKYLLTMKNLNYKIIRSYSLALRPIELSVIENIEGDDIFLYDVTHFTNNKPKKRQFNKQLKYSLRTNESKILLNFAVKLSMENLLRKIKSIPRRVRRYKNKNKKV